MYAKVFNSLWQGSLGPQWGAWSTFVFMLAHADRKGFVDLHPDYIARVSGIPRHEVDTAIEILSTPDPSSRSDDHEGRRIVPIDGERDWGWVIVNHSYYRSLKDQDEQRVKATDRKRRSRSRIVPLGHAPSQQSEADPQSDSESEACERDVVTPSRALPRQRG